MDDNEDNDLPLNDRIDLINRNDPSVTKFELEYSERETVTEDQIRALFRALRQNTHVRKLDLSWTPRELLHTVCIGLLPPLLRENSSIKYLGFPLKMTNAEFLPSVDTLCNNNNNTTVKTLRMHSCDIRGRDGGEMIGRLIWNNHHITTIDLRRNPNLGSAGAARIAAALGNETCALKTLYLNFCGIGNEGVDALCTARQVNNSLETFWFGYNQITDEGYRALARSLPYMSGLQEIRFAWEHHRMSAVVLQQMMDGLRKNHSLLRIAAVDVGNLSEEQRREWSTCCAFVGARNKMNCHLDKAGDATRDGRVAPVPIPIGPLLWWCCRQGNAEVQASLIYPLLGSRSNKLVGLADIVAEEDDGEKEKAITDMTTTRTGDPQSETTTRADATKPCVESMLSEIASRVPSETTRADATTTRTGDMRSETTRRAPRSVRKWISLLCCRREAKSR